MTNKNLTAVCDLDAIKWAAAATGEKRTIIAIHKQSGREKEFTNRTELWGRGKQIGGWLGEQNEKRDSPWTKDDFIIKDVQTPEPLEFCLHTAKAMHKNWLSQLGTDKYIGFIGEGDSFRVEKSTLRQYKGHRKDLIRPVHLEAVIDYIKKYLAHEVVTGYENDDRCVMEAYKKPDHIVLGAEKDFYAQAVRYMNMSKPEEGIIDCDCFGKLWLDDKGKVRGYGRLFLYWQTCSLDSSDGYSAGCFSDIKWGEKSAYKELVDCQNDKEALSKLVDIFKYLYPEPKTVVGWRGDDIDIDWLYVADECFQMAKMRRWDGDEFHLKSVLDNLGVQYD